MPPLFGWLRWSRRVSRPGGAVVMIDLDLAAFVIASIGVPSIGVPSLETSDLQDCEVVTMAWIVKDRHIGTRHR